jgi:hypothetical protein
LEKASIERVGQGPFLLRHTNVHRTVFRTSTWRNIPANVDANTAGISGGVGYKLEVANCDLKFGPKLIAAKSGGGRIFDIALCDVKIYAKQNLTDRKRAPYADRGCHNL